MLVGIVVPSYNDQVFLRELLPALFVNTPQELIRVLVVDDGSDDGTAEWLLGVSRGWFDLIHTSNIRFTRVCNEGLRWLRQHVNPDWYMLLNSDTRPTPGWLQAMLTTAHRTGAAIVGCKLLLGDGRIHHAGAYGAGFHYHIMQPNCSAWSERYVPWVTGALMMIRRDCYERLGDLPVGPEGEHYDASDRGYITRAWKAGFMCAVSPAIVYHYTDASRKARDLE